MLDIDADCARLHDELTDLVKATAPSLLALPGVGVHTAALLLVAAGDNAERITSEAAFAHLCGVAPIHASSGKTDPSPAQPGRQPPSQPRPVAHRVHPHGLGPTHPRLRRTPHALEGRSKPEIMRVLKRYVAREVYRHLPSGSANIERRAWPPKCQHAPRLSCERLPARRSTFPATPRGLIRARPPTSSGPSLVCPHPSPKPTLDKT